MRISNITDSSGGSRMYSCSIHLSTQHHSMEEICGSLEREFKRVSNDLEYTCHLVESGLSKRFCHLFLCINRLSFNPPSRFISFSHPLHPRFPQRSKNGAPNLLSLARRLQAMELKMAGAKEKGDRLIARKADLLVTTTQTIMENFNSLESTTKSNKLLNRNLDGGREIRDFLCS